VSGFLEILIALRARAWAPMELALEGVWARA
jgi:hypothetical protein